MAAAQQRKRLMTALDGRCRTTRRDGKSTERYDKPRYHLTRTAKIIEQAAGAATRSIH
jgi:hypothetical protein